MHKSSQNSVLIKGGELFDPEKRGEKDILVVGGEILKIADEIEPPRQFEIKIIDATGKLIVPGFIDSHVHLTGGGGESGPSSRVPEISLSEIVSAGVTGVAGLLGTDNVTRSLGALLGKTKALNQAITALAYTGSYHLPSVTVTGSVKKDIALINEFIGVKLAISDHRSSQPTSNELAKLASQARVGGMLGDKPGIVHVHVGGGSKGLEPIFKAVEGSEIPLSQFVPTHMGRSTSLLQQQGVDFINRGGCIDITCPGDPEERKTWADTIMKTLAESEVSLSHVTLSSDSNGSMPDFDEDGNLTGIRKAKIQALPDTVKALAESGFFSLPEILRLVTVNPAQRLGIFNQTGSLQEGKSGDFLIVTTNLEIEQVFASGRLLVDGNQVLVEDPFE
ncbi:MAG: beta-aspartyl-peptidase [Candidatus Bipolaricaulota bacterium]